MRISPVSMPPGFATVSEVKPAQGPVGGALGQEIGSPGGVSFKDTMKDAIGKVNDLQNEADSMANKLASGDLEDVHQAILAMNKAKSAFDFTLAVRNKVIEAYQEIMRTQV